MIDAKDVKKVLDLMIDEEQIRMVILSLHEDRNIVENLLDNFSDNSLDFYKNIKNEYRKKMAEAIANKLNN